VLFLIYCGKILKTGHATDDNMAHAHCMLDNVGHKYILRICNTYCFSTATMIARIRLVITLYTRTLPILFYTSGIINILGNL